MKYLKILTLIAVALFSSFTFCSCSNDDNPTIPDNIIGTWYYEEIHEIGNYTEYYMEYYVFNTDGTFAFVEIQDDDAIETTGTYSIKDNQITLVTSKGTETYRFGITNNGQKLFLEEPDGDRTHYIKV